ncbi:MAG TPA: transposase [Bryobacteraceae bacterium]|nr:transposase [Bryobacteraceae bacterium]
MPRPLRVIIPGVAHHVTQRGNYRQKVFYRDEDRSFYVELLTEYSRHYGVSVLAWCLMANHVHLVAVPHDERALSADAAADPQRLCESLASAAAESGSPLAGAFSFSCDG